MLRQNPTTNLPRIVNYPFQHTRRNGQACVVYNSHVNNSNYSTLRMLENNFPYLRDVYEVANV